MSKLAVSRPDSKTSCPQPPESVLEPHTDRSTPFIRVAAFVRTWSERTARTQQKQLTPQPLAPALRVLTNAATSFLKPHAYSPPPSVVAAFVRTWSGRTARTQHKQPSHSPSHPPPAFSRTQLQASSHPTPTAHPLSVVAAFVRTRSGTSSDHGGDKTFRAAKFPRTLPHSHEYSHEPSRCPRLLTPTPAAPGSGRTES